MCVEKRFDGKVALVTGGSRGIGRAICIKLASLGAKVFINYASNEDAAKGVIDEIKAGGGLGELCKFDVSDYQQVNAAIKEIFSVGGLHILVNCAGITKDTLLARMKPDDWAKVVAVNLTGVFNCTQSAISGMMKQRWGRIINVGSIIGSIGNAGQANYAATKAGLEGFTKSVAREVASRGITANVIAPGFIDTDMTSVLSEDMKTALLKQIPAGRMGRSQDVAEAVSFLASEDASYITGHVLHVNGGLLCE